MDLGYYYIIIIEIIGIIVCIKKCNMVILNVLGGKPSTLTPQIGPSAPRLLFIYQLRANIEMKERSNTCEISFLRAY